MKAPAARSTARTATSRVAVAAPRADPPPGYIPGGRGSVSSPTVLLSIHLYLVESVREDGRAKQRIIKNLGRKDAVLASGELERLAASIGRYAERAIVFSQLQAGDLDGLSCKRIGAPLLFGRLWQDTGCRAVIDELLAARGFEYPLERAVFVSVLHRTMVSGSDRACEKWMTDCDIPGLPRKLCRSAGRCRRLRPAHHQGPDRGTAVRAPARPVQRALGSVHGHHVAVVYRRRWRDAG